MLYGAMNFPIKPTLDELERIASFGFDYLELTMDPPCAHFTTIQTIKQELLTALGHHGMKLVCHLPTFVYTADLAPGIRQASMHEMLSSLETAADIGAMKVVLHPSIFSGMGAFVKEEARYFADQSLSVIVEKAEELGITLCFENMFPRYIAFFEPWEFQEVFGRFPGLKMTLDTGHANIGDPAGKKLIEFVRKFKDRIGHIHASDNLAKRDDHLPIGRGTIDFVRFARALKEIGYNDTVTLEIFSEDPADLKESLETFTSIMDQAM